MALFLHGLANADAPLPHGAAIHHRLALPPYLALCSDLDQLLPDANSADQSGQAALAHNRLLTLYAQQGDVVPVRFGAPFSTVSAVLSYLDQVRPAVEAAFRQIEGAQEFLVRLTAVTPQHPTAALDGRSFLQARQARRDGMQRMGARQVQLIADLEQSLSGCTRDRRVQSPASRGALAEITLLVPRVARTEFEHLARRWHDLAAEMSVRLAVTGPWPAYAFSTVEHADA